MCITCFMLRQHCSVSYLFFAKRKDACFSTLHKTSTHHTPPSCHSSTKKVQAELGITFLARYVLIVSTLYITFLLRQVEWWYMPDIMAQRTLHIFSLLASSVSSQPHKTGIFSFFFSSGKKNVRNGTRHILTISSREKRTSRSEHVPFFPLMLTTSTTPTVVLFLACKMLVWGTRVL